MFLKDTEEMTNVLPGILQFRPSLEEAMNYLPGGAALNYFESENLTSLVQKEEFVSDIANGYLNLFTIDELPGLVQEYINQLREDSDFIIKTGYPRHTFCKHGVLNEMSRLFYTRCPETMTFYNLSKNKTECTISYHKSEFWDLLDFMKFRIPVNDRVLIKYTWKDGSYLNSPILKGLSSNDVNLIEKTRHRLFEIKINILGEILKSINKRDASDLWMNCLKILSEDSKKDFVKFFMLEEKEIFESGSNVEREVSIDIGNNKFKLKKVIDAYWTGGIMQVLNTIGFFEKEIKIGTLSKTKEILHDLPSDIHLDSYYQFINQSEQSLIDFAFETFMKLYNEETKFYHELDNRVINTGFELVFPKVTLPVEYKYYSVVSKFYETIKSADEMGGASFQMNFMLQKFAEKKEKEQPVIPFPTPKSTTWDKVTIRFITPETVEIRIGEYSEGRIFKELGFEDRKTRNPDKIWRTFLTLAKAKGDLSGKDGVISPKEYGQVRKNISELRKRLIRIFGIKASPIYDYREYRSYRTKFKLSVSDNFED